MKFFAYSFSILFLFQSCSEILPDPARVDTKNSLQDTVYLKSTTSTPQERVVLMEEFTGASCTNCPAAHAVISDILSTVGHERLSVISLHPEGNSLARPVETGEEDLRTEGAKLISEKFGVTSMPLALLDRTSKSGGNPIYGKGEWVNTINQLITETPQANITSKVEYDNDHNKYRYDLEIELLEDISENLVYTIAILEDSIRVTQINGSAHVADYPQLHVLRKYLTNATGSTLPNINGATTYAKGTVIKKQILLDLDSKWKDSYLSVVAFVSKETSTDKRVLQSSHAKFK